MQDNLTRTGSNWGSTPRQSRDAFPQYPGPLYREPTVAQKIADVLVMVALVAIVGIIAVVGPALLGA